MQKAKLCKLAMLGLSAALVFGCQAKADDQAEFTQEQVQEYRNHLSAQEQKQFDRLSKEDQIKEIRRHSENDHFNGDDSNGERIRGCRGV